jgi:hypothetical protein
MGDPDEEDDRGEPWANFLRSWRIVEYFLDVCIMTLFQRHGDQISEKETPVSLDRRLRFLRLAYGEVEALRGFQGVAKRTIERLTAHQSLRNDIVHGFPMKIEPNGTTHIVWPQLRKQKIHYHLRVVTRRQWDDFAARNGAILGGLLLLYFGLHPEGMGLDEGENITRELTVKQLARLPASKRVRQLFEELASGLPDE